VALYKNSGSIDFVASCPSVFLIAKHPEHQDQRVLSHVRNKLLKPQPSLGFSIEDSGLVWKEELRMTADEIIASAGKRERQQPQLKEAKELLKKTLANGPASSNDIMKAAKDAGISERTMFKAKEELGVRARKERFGPWWWQFPNEEEG
jgi:hypothetical protein